MEPAESTLRCSSQDGASRASVTRALRTRILMRTQHSQATHANAHTDFEKTHKDSDILKVRGDDL